MKKIIVVSVALVVLSACGGGDSKADNGTGLSKNPDYQKGLALVSKSDCATCHKIDEPLTGPPFRDIANKYAVLSNRDSVVDYLEKKIISGGTGVWGQVPMIPHPIFSDDDAKAIVKYILLLKK